jgi:Protein of unknown function (DUF3035)
VTHLQRNFAIAAVMALAATGCTGMKESMGATKQSPDETAVTARAPLVVPATFALKTPTPGAPRPQDADAATQAQRVLGGSPKLAAATQGELELLAASGATKADPNIRQELRSEVVKQGKRKSYSDTVLFWRGRKGDAGTPLDANEEAVRLASQGPVTPSNPSQAEPVIEKESTSASAPSDQEKKAAEKESSGGWFNWF